MSWTQRAREHDPLAVSGVEIGWILFHARRYDEATRQLRSVLALDPNEPVALWNLGFMLIANDHPEKAIPILEKAASLSDADLALSLYSSGPMLTPVVAPKHFAFLRN